MKMQRKVSEKLIENFVRDYPQVFLGEDLTLLEQQPTVFGLKPDLLFEDSTGRKVVVELQLGNLNKGHLYRALEYRDAYMGDGNPMPRIILVSERLREKHETAIRIHNLEHIELSVVEFIQRARLVNPHFEVPVKEEPEKVMTLKQLMASFNGKCQERHDEMDKWVFWWCCDGRPNVYEVLPLPEAHIPYEIVVSGAEELCDNDWDDVILWLQFLAGERDVIMVTPGLGPLHDAYRNYIKKGLCRPYSELHHRYMGRDEWDIEKIRSTLNKMSSIQFHVGSYGSFSVRQFFKSFEICNGVPQKFLDDTRRRFNHIIDDWDERVDEAKTDADGWVWVRFHGVDRFLTTGIIMSLTRMMGNYFKGYNTFLTSPKRLGKVPQDALELSSKFLGRLCDNGLCVPPELREPPPVPKYNSPLL